MDTITTSFIPFLIRELQKALLLKIEADWERLWKNKGYGEQFAYPPETGTKHQFQEDLAVEINVFVESSPLAKRMNKVELDRLTLSGSTLERLLMGQSQNLKKGKKIGLCWYLGYEDWDDFVEEHQAAYEEMIKKMHEDVVEKVRNELSQLPTLLAQQIHNSQVLAPQALPSSAGTAPAASKYGFLLRLSLVIATFLFLGVGLGWLIHALFQSDPYNPLLGSTYSTIDIQRDREMENGISEFIKKQQNKDNDSVQIVSTVAQAGNVEILIQQSLPVVDSLSLDTYFTADSPIRKRIIASLLRNASRGWKATPDSWARVLSIQIDSIIEQRAYVSSVQDWRIELTDEEKHNGTTYDLTDEQLFVLIKENKKWKVQDITHRIIKK